MTRRSGSSAVTRAEVARLAGVSTAVVSYVVNGGPKRVSPNTAARVRKAISDLQYQPNANARALTTGSPKLLGFIAPDLTNSFFAELGDAIGAAASQRGYDVIVASSHDDPERERSITVNLVGRRVDGIIAATVLDTASLATMAVGSTVRVLVDNTVTVPGIASVSTDLEDGGLQATRHLIGHGYTDVAIVTGRFEVPGQVDARRDGWQRALLEAGLPTGPVILTDFTREGGYLATRAAIRSRSAPRAIFAASDLIAVGVLRAVHEAGLRVPDDVAIVSFDGSVESEYSWPPLTTVRQPIRMIADSALESALDPAAIPPTRLQFRGDLILRTSCGCATAPPRTPPPAPSAPLAPGLQLRPGGHPAAGEPRLLPPLGPFEVELP